MAAVRRESVERVIERFTAAAQAFAQAGDTGGLAEAWIEQARAIASSFRSDDLDHALTLLDRAAEHLDGDEETAATLRARYHHVRGYTLLRAGRFDEAAADLRAAERMCHAAGDATGEARALDTLGVLFERRDDAERAALCFAHSHALKQRSGDDHGVAISLGNLGRLALHGGKPREAEGFLRLDLELAEQLGDTRGEAVVRTNLAECLLAQGRPDEARSVGEAALALALDLGSDVSAGHARLVLAAIDLAAHDLAQARAQGEAALAAFLGVGMTAGVADARLLLARVARAAEAGRAAVAMALRAAAIARRHGHRDTAVEALLEAHAQLEDAGLRSSARRALARAHDVAHGSGRDALVDRVRTRQAADDVGLALRAASIRIDIEQGIGDLADRRGSMTFEVEGFLGAGAFATVLRVRDATTDARYAWKQLQGGRVRAAALADRVRREFRVLSAVETSPHLVRVHAVGARDGAPGVLLDLVEASGRHASLQAALDDFGRMPLAPVLRTLAEVVHGLQTLHAAGIVHRDVKPGNVLFGPGGRAVLTDCGLAFDPADEQYVPTSALAGSLAYAAPELLATDGRWVLPTPAADAYALGVTLHRALTGAWPVPLEGDLASVLRSKHERDPDLGRLPATPADLRPLAGALLSRDPTARPATAEIATRLRAMLASDG